MPVAPAARSRQVAFLRQWSRLLDSVFRVPGTSFRFGWDPIIGLVPGAGEAVSAAFGAVVLVQALRLGVPRIVVLRMVVNLLIDLGVGAIPIVGDAFDFAWKSNDRNLALLLQHEHPGRLASSGDWAFVVSILVAIGSAVAMVALAVAWLGLALARLFLS